MKFKDMPYFRPDMEKIGREYAGLIKEVSAAKTGEELVDCINRHEVILRRFETMASLASIRHTLNTFDAFYDAEKNFFDETGPLFEEKKFAFYDALLVHPHRIDAERICGEIFFRVIENERKCFSEKIIPLLQKENALASRYQKLIAGAKIHFDGKILNVPQLGPYKVSTDRETRRKALYAEGEFYRSVGGELDEIFDKMVSVRTQIAKELGYSSFTDVGYLRMGRISYGREDVARFRDSVRRYVVPFVCTLKERQARFNGIDDPKMYDDGILFPDGNAKPRGTKDDILAAGKKMYESLSPDCASFIDHMISCDLMDLEAREGKATGGYCESLPDYRSTFIFSNFNGTEDDVNVLTHEAGHSFADYMVRDFPFRETMNPTMEGCETHSMSMEFFAWRFLSDFYGKDAEKAAYSHLFDSLSFLPYGCMVDEFQHAVYDHPELSPAERHQVWERLEKAYRPYLDRTDIPFYGENRGWQRQLHIYLYPFYYIDYCLAQTMALAFWAESQKDYDSAFSRYLTFVKAGGTLGFTDLCRKADMTDPFDERCIRMLLPEAERWFADHAPENLTAK